MVVSGSKVQIGEGVVVAHGGLVEERDVSVVPGVGVRSVVDEAWVVGAVEVGKAAVDGKLRPIWRRTSSWLKGTILVEERDTSELYPPLELGAMLMRLLFLRFLRVE